MALNFKDALNTKVGDIERPPLPPIGTYVFQITKVPVIREQSGGDNQTWDVVDFNCIAVEAVNVDDAELQEFGSLKNITQRVSFMFDKGDQTAFDTTMSRLRTFLEKHVKVADESMSLSEALNASVNGRFLGEVGWRPDKRNPEVMFANIGKTAPVEA